MSNVDYKNGFLVQGASATQGPFNLIGGEYGVSVAATFGGGSVALQILGPDGSTFVTVGSAFTANGYASVFLPPGQYQVNIATATAVNFSCSPISFRR